MNGTASPSDMFDARVLRANALERSVIGRPYFELLFSSKDNHLGRAMNACQSEHKPGSTMQFVAVMDVQANGNVENVEIRPANAWTTCIAKQVESSSKLPPPPKLASPSGYPLIYEVRMK